MINLGSIILTPLRKQRPQKAVTKRSKSSLSSAELAECTCPEPCERDHEND
jgi:hypothetical protein